MKGSAAVGEAVNIVISQVKRSQYASCTSGRGGGCTKKAQKTKMQRSSPDITIVLPIKVWILPQICLNFAA